MNRADEIVDRTEKSLNESNNRSDRAVENICKKIDNRNKWLKALLITYITSIIILLGYFIKIAIK